MKNRNKQIISFGFVLLLLFAIIPQHVFHLLQEHHHGIEHIDLDCHSTHFEVNHIHCDDITLSLPLFLLGDVIHTYLSFENSFFYLENRFHFVATPIHFMFALKSPPILLHIL